MPALHDDQLAIDSEPVRRLARRSTLPSSGSSNALFRVGDHLLARLPGQPGGSATIDKDARWLPRIAPRLTVAVPEVVAPGEPGHGYPER